MKDNQFEIEFGSDEEIGDMLDGIVAAIGGQVLEDESKPAIINPIKIKQMQFAYGVMQYLTKGTNARVSYSMHEPFKSMGSVSIEAKVISFANAEWFARAAEFASNTEVYPLANGKVRMTLTFHGLVRPIS